MLRQLVILGVLDQSTSMSGRYAFVLRDSAQREAPLKQALYRSVQQIYKDEPGSRIAITSFYGRTGLSLQFRSATREDEVLDTVAKFECIGMNTNYTSGLEPAVEIANSRNTAEKDNRKLVVIFITDGFPERNGKGKVTKSPNEPEGGYSGDFNADNWGDANWIGCNQWNALKQAYGNNFYFVPVGIGVQNNKQTNAGKYLRALARYPNVGDIVPSEDKDKYISVTNTADIYDAIAKAISFTAPESTIDVEDTLSNHFELYLDDHDELIASAGVSTIQNGRIQIKNAAAKPVIDNRIPYR